MENSVNIRIVLFCLLLFSLNACDSTKQLATTNNTEATAGFGQASFEVKFFQFGKDLPVEDGKVHLQKDAFSIVVVGKYLDGIYAHTSFTEKPEFANPAVLPKVENLSGKVMAETAFNGDKELLFSEDGYCYWFLDEAASWHRLNKAFRVGAYVLLEKDVVQIWNTETEKAVALKDLTENLYLYFFNADAKGQVTDGEYIRVVWQ